jgi:hypothetical protein
MLAAIRQIASRVNAPKHYKCLILKGFVGNQTQIVTFGVRMGDSPLKRAFLFSPLLLAGCASHGVHPLRPLEIPTASYNGVITTALTGTLMYERGCLMFRDDGKRIQLVPVWPTGSVFNGTSVIFHEPGRADQRVVVGEEFLVEGQPLQWSRVPGPRIVLHQRRCGGEPFAVLGVRPAN